MTHATKLCCALMRVRAPVDRAQCPDARSAREPAGKAKIKSKIQKRKRNERRGEGEAENTRDARAEAETREQAGTDSFAKLNSTSTPAAFSRISLECQLYVTYTFHTHMMGRQTWRSPYIAHGKRALPVTMTT